MEYDKNKSSIYKSIRDSGYHELKNKHIRQYDKEFLYLTSATEKMSVLEIGCGTGIFLKYLKHRNFIDVHAVDYDENLKESLSDLDDFDITFMDAEEYVDSICHSRSLIES